MEEWNFPSVREYMLVIKAYHYINFVPLCWTKPFSPFIATISRWQELPDAALPDEDFCNQFYFTVESYAVEYVTRQLECITENRNLY